MYNSHPFSPKPTIIDSFDNSSKSNYSGRNKLFDMKKTFFITAFALVSAVAGLVTLQAPLNVQAAIIRPIDDLKQGIALNTTTGTVNCNPQGSNPVVSEVYAQPATNATAFILPVITDAQDNLYIRQNDTSMLQRVAPNCSYTQWLFPSNVTLVSQYGVLVRNSKVYVEYYNFTTDTYDFGYINESTSRLVRLYTFPDRLLPQAITLNAAGTRLYFAGSYDQPNIYTTDLTTGKTRTLISEIPPHAYVWKLMIDSSDNVYTVFSDANDLSIYEYRPNLPPVWMPLSYGQNYSYQSASMLEYNGEVRMYTAVTMYTNNFTVQTGQVEEIKMATAQRRMVYTGLNETANVDTSSTTGQVHVAHSSFNSSTRTITAYDLNAQAVRNYNYPAVRNSSQAGYFSVTPAGNYAVAYSSYYELPHILTVTKATY
jgi:hypothetical protein